MTLQRPVETRRVRSWLAIVLERVDPRVKGDHGAGEGEEQRRQGNTIAPRTLARDRRKCRQQGGRSGHC